MFGRFGRALGILIPLGIILLLTSSGVFAMGTGPDDAMAPSNDWVTSSPGDVHWYVFRDEGDLSGIQIVLDAEPNDAVTLEVLTPDQVELWRKGMEYEPVGRGSPNPAIKADLSWAGNFNISGNYYVIVRHHSEQAGSYLLKIEGDDVSFPTLAVEPKPAAAPAVQPAERAPAAGMAMFAADGQWRTLTTGESHWYAIPYGGDNATLQIAAEEVVDGRVTFSVWTPDLYARKMKGEEVEPIGRSSENPCVHSGALNWTGNFNFSGTIYVLVEHTCQAGPGEYVLNVSGAQMEAMAEPMPAEEVPAAPEPEPMARASEPAAGMFSVDGEWRTLEMGESHWYSFVYGGDNEPLQIAMEEVVDGRATFSVWTADLYARKMKGEEVDPIGRSSENPCVYSGALNWSGSFNFSGTIYVMVEHTCQAGPAEYVLSVTGAQ